MRLRPLLEASQPARGVWRRSQNPEKCAFLYAGGSEARKQASQFLDPLPEDLLKQENGGVLRRDPEQEDGVGVAYCSSQLDVHPDGVVNQEIGPARVEP